MQILFLYMFPKLIYPVSNAQALTVALRVASSAFSLENNIN